MADANETIVRRAVEEILGKGNLALVDELIAPNYVGHVTFIPETMRGPEAARKVVQTFRTAFPDLTFTIEDLFTAGDKVACRFTAQGTHQGELMGIRPTGRRGAVSGIALFRVVNGKIVEEWANWDALSMLQQLGVRSIEELRAA
ncbi:MAG: ester cyclase [Chloroflexi bacterium]|nr:ester cyclase [Chloroflexota bacterium]